MNDLINAYYFDFQGTLVDVRGIRHLLETTPKRYDSFHYATASCPPISWVASEARRAHEEGFAVLLGTGMTERFRPLVNFWLASHEVHVDDLQMRPDDDFCKDFILKNRMLRRWQNTHRFVHAYDDNPAVIEHVWAAANIPHTTVPGWGEG
jgi:hypothetical protein